MGDEANTPDDGLGPPQVDRSGGKGMAAGRGGGGGGSDIDPSYETALRILGRESEMPSPFEQRALVMSDSEAADLAGSLTSLLGQVSGGFANMRPDDQYRLAQAPLANELIAALEDREPEGGKLQELSDRIDKLDYWSWRSFNTVLTHPAVQAKLGASAPHSTPPPMWPPDPSEAAQP
jgi:hypothetical protein